MVEGGQKHRLRCALAAYPTTATQYGAFECGAIRNICRQDKMPEAKAVRGEIELAQKTPLFSEPVAERALGYYSELVG